ncbi:cell division topological specificity factor MinE [Methylomagnum ishizawai]|uniref:cell division topological specificity factor MinE n=1 Tax=Methylomagnum ishizawai TaxID=1760988 RepID=UPI001C3365C4|nr:cell division topological specificity factor MinE [Methylomagnum ishizawai]BBL73159.1 cell division topological specificity factor [Methylomagnum ishizawai]
MGLLDYFRSSKPTSAAIAKERLQILVAHERSQRNRPDYLADLQRDLLEVIRKYVNVDQDAITVTMEQDDSREILELNIILPEEAEQKRTPPRPQGKFP